jgi:hypothetical protein
LRSQRAFSAGFFILSDLNDKDVPDVTGKIESDESINFGDNNGFTEKDDSDIGTLTRFNHNPTFSHGFNQEDKEILGEADEIISLKRSKKVPRSTKTRGKRSVTAVGKFKQF